MRNDEHDVQGSGDIADRDQILLCKGGPEENICSSEEQVSAQADGMPELTISSFGTTQQENTDEDRKAVGFEAADRMRRALSRSKWPDAEEVADSFGDHRAATSKN